MSDIALGIDLGTTNSVVAAVDGGRIRVITDADKQYLQPSVVAFPPNGKVMVGVKAKLRKIIDPANTVFSIKRIIGQPFSRPRVQEAISRYPFDVVEGENQESVVKTRAGALPVPQISSYVLAHMRKIAEKTFGRAMSSCVVTVPANFNDGQRHATRRAAEAAGLDVLRILNEPTAAALAYGHGQKLHQRLAVFDFGGGTFDMSLLKVHNDLFEVQATGGDSFLGGDDMDKLVAEHLAMEFLRQHRFDLRTDRISFAKLMIVAEQIKMRLSKEKVVEDVVEELAYGDGGKPLALEFRITREEFNALIAIVVDRAMSKAESVLLQAGVTPDRVDEVILAGGTTRVPMVYQRVAELFDRKPHADIDPMQVVAAGAGLHAYNLHVMPETAHEAAGLLMDVTSHSLGIATTGGYAEHLIDKNITIPAEGTRVFTTASDSQTTVRIRVCQGESKSFDKNDPVGELRLDNLRSARRGVVKVEVSFIIDADGILNVSAKDLETGRNEQAVLTILGVNNTALPSVAGPAGFEPVPVT